MKKLLLFISLISFNMVVSAKTVYEEMFKDAVMDNTVNIDYTKHGSQEFGEGIFIISDTKDDKNPILYYRGNANNNIIFNNYCGKIVRTTDTGGIKIAITGKLNEENVCSDIEDDLLNYYHGNPSIGYMTEHNGFSKIIYNSYFYNKSSYYYADSYEYSNGKYTLKDAKKWGNNIKISDKYLCTYDNYGNCSENKIYYLVSDSLALELTDGMLLDNKKINIKYGNDIIYENGKYKLIDVVESSEYNWKDNYEKIASRYHYTCLSDSDTCDKVSYIYNLYLNFYNVVTLENGEMDPASVFFTKNEFDSNEKVMLDDWYKDNLLQYTKYIEDTVYCNDRSIYDYGMFDKDKDLTNTKLTLYFSGYNRYYNLKKPTLDCTNESDRFTVSSKIGNGMLTYPIGGLTIDELMYAGNENLYSTITPYLYNLTGDSYDLFNNLGSSTSHYGGEEGSIFDFFLPTISLNPGTLILSGDGSMDNPYILNGVLKEDINDNKNDNNEENNNSEDNKNIEENKNIDNPQTLDKVIYNILSLIILIMTLCAIIILRLHIRKKYNE